MSDDEFSDDGFIEDEEEIDKNKKPQKKPFKINSDVINFDEEVEDEENEDENENENEENEDFEEIEGDSDVDDNIKEINEDDLNVENLLEIPTNAKQKKNAKKNDPQYDTDDTDDDEEDEDDENYLQKFDENTKKNAIELYHPELQSHNYEEIEILSNVIRNEEGIIIDPFHKTLPFITKYEKARILGERAKQINSGDESFIVKKNSDDGTPAENEKVIDGYLIALNEFENKKIPFIIKRPLPNGGCEYWKLKDLDII